MENKGKNTSNAELFYKLRNAEIQMADSLIFITRAMQLIFVMLAIAAGIALDQFIDHWMIALAAAAILVTSIAAIFVIYFALPATADEFFEGPEELEEIATQENWRLPD